MIQSIYETIKNYSPSEEQERQDQAVMLQYIRQFDNILERENVFAHFTASPWIVNQDRSRVLLLYHRIFDSWGWCGGHSDGDSDFLSTALREGREETGLTTIRPVSSDILALDVIPVIPHVRKGAFVTAHVHLNVTYLCTADDSEPLRHKDDEAKGARWVSPEEVIPLVSPWDRVMIPIYEKLNRKTFSDIS
ncbi:MAG: NUDIX hydrolase [Lachnospiraceae bacterium]|nr:NUDIX hydrolase [Lachnospiraceae bacterium]